MKERPKFVVGIPVDVEYTQKSTSVTVGMKVFGAESPDEESKLAKEAAVEFGKRIGAEATEGPILRRSDSNSQSSFGFSNWNGSNWEPKGPTRKPLGSSKPELN